MSRLCLSAALLLLLGTLWPAPSGVERGVWSKPCHLPPYMGPCRALFIRYFYNASSGLCKTFTYGRWLWQGPGRAGQLCFLRCWSPTRPHRAGLWLPLERADPPPLPPSQTYPLNRTLPLSSLHSHHHPPFTMTALLGGEHNGISRIPFWGVVVAEAFSLKKSLSPRWCCLFLCQWLWPLALYLINSFSNWKNKIKIFCSAKKFILVYFLRKILVCICQWGIDFILFYSIRLFP